MRTPLTILIMSFILLSAPGFSRSLKDKFQLEASNLIGSSEPLPDKKTIVDTNHLPDIVQKYIFRTEFYGKEQVRNMKVTFEGKIRSKPGDGWMKLKAYQVSSFETQTRLFYIKASKMGIPAIGLHCLKNGKASMKVKLLGLFTIVDVAGELMDKSELVTHFNDMCLMAPGTLIDPNIRWKEIDSTTVKAYYTCNNETISATLYFNSDGYLLNFISNDRYNLSVPEKPELYPFSTPINCYSEMNGYTLSQTTQTVYTMPKGEFVYGVFSVKSIEYNVKNPKF